MSSRYQGTIDDVAISPTSRSDDFNNGILTFVTYRCSQSDRLRPMIAAMLRNIEQIYHQANLMFVLLFKSIDGIFLSRIKNF